MERQPRHLTPAFAVSVAVHASALAAVLWLFSQATRDEQRATSPRPEQPRLVWIPDPRPASRGGGGAPPKTLPPPEPAPAVVAPPAKPVVITEPDVIAPEPEPAPLIATAPAVATVDQAPGTLSTGVGDKPGTGIGDQPGPGSGGDDVFGVGNGVSAPIPVRRPPPAYTAEAMRARLQGVVVLSCVVRPNGRCSDIRIMKSLDMMFGLDEQAVASAREWVFRPGQRMGQAVPVVVSLEIGFTIR